MVRLGVGVIIEKDGKILIGKRKNSHAPYYSIPGGKMDEGESFENAAIREVFEETGLRIKNPKVISISNNLQTFRNEGVHYVSVILYTNNFEGNLKVMETEKCDGWQWCDPQNLPQPHFEASTIAVDCFLQNRFY